MKPLLTLKELDEVIAVIQKPTDIEALDILLTSIALLITALKKHQQNVIAELLEMYNSASEHNIDVSREAVYQLAMKLSEE